MALIDIAEHEGSPNSYPRGLDAELLSVELENQRLEDEILKLKILKDRRKIEDGGDHSLLY